MANSDAKIRKLIRDITKFCNDYQKFADDFNSGKVARDIVNNISKDVIRDLNAIHKKAIDVFYGSYKPDYYDRLYSLYDMYEITYNNGIINIHTGPDLVEADWENVEDPDTQHRVGADYIFDKMFSGGWHGGATHSDKLDDAGNEYPSGFSMAYRKPVADVYKTGDYGPYLYMRRFGYWSHRRVARMKGSPMKIIEIQKNKYLNGQKNTSGSTCDKRIADGINKIFNNYDLFKK